MKIKKTNFVYKYLQFGKNTLDFFFKDIRRFLLIVIIGLFGLLIITKFKSLFFTAVLIVLGAISMIYIRFFKYAHFIGFELCMMATVLTSIAYGPHYGAFTGFVSLSAALILSGYFKPTYFVSVLTMPLMGLIVPLFSHLDLWLVGIIMTIIYDAIVLPLYVLMGSRITSSVVFFITHILLNYWVFTTIAPIILSIM